LQLPRKVSASTYPYAYQKCLRHLVISETSLLCLQLRSLLCFEFDPKEKQSGYRQYDRGSDDTKPENWVSKPVVQVRLNIARHGPPSFVSDSAGLDAPARQPLHRKNPC
jgi:hypothetical protein